MAQFTGTAAPEVVSPFFVSNTVSRNPPGSFPSDAEDFIFLGSGADFARGGGGDDFIDGWRGADDLRGGAGSDTILGWTGNDSIRGGPGNDVLNGEQDNDFIQGNAGADTLIGGAGDDTLDGNGGGAGELSNGGPGNDYIFANNWVPETLIGGSGRDWLDTTKWNFTYEINLATGVTNYGGESFTQFENVITGAGDDVLIGTNGSNEMRSGDGDDRIASAGGRDDIFGGRGDDSLDGGGGNDNVFGEMGNDTVKGGAGNDLVRGNLGDDVVDGGGGNDTVEGGSGNDVIDGRQGADLASGGAGADEFIYRTYNSNPGETDIILDFASGVDVLNFVSARRWDGAFIADGMDADTNSDGKISQADMGWSLSGGDLMFNGLNGDKLILDGVTMIDAADII